MKKAGFSQLLYLRGGGGMLIAIPAECAAEWDVDEDRLAEIADATDGFRLWPIGETEALVIADDDGVNEAHWMSFDSHLHLVIWCDWPDSDRTALPEDLEAIAHRWMRGEDPRRSWLIGKLTDARWRLAGSQGIRSGSLILSVADGCPANRSAATEGSVATDAEIVPVEISAGEYRIETAILDEMLEHGAFVLVARWVEADK